MKKGEVNVLHGQAIAIVNHWASQLVLFEPNHMQKAHYTARYGFWEWIHLNARLLVWTLTTQFLKLRPNRLLAKTEEPALYGLFIRTYNKTIYFIASSRKLIYCLGYGECLILDCIQFASLTMKNDKILCDGQYSLLFSCVIIQCRIKTFMCV